MISPRTLVYVFMQLIILSHFLCLFDLGVRFFSHSVNRLSRYGYAILICLFLRLHQMILPLIM